MEEFESKRKIKILTKEFISKNIYVLVLAVLLLGGITYGYTFFKENMKVASGSITTASLTINFSDRNISASSLSVPNNNKEGLSEYVKTLTITNQTSVVGVVKLTLSRTSGLNLTDMSYALVVNGAIQEIGDVPANGEILTTAIMGNETLNVEVRLWPKTSYSGSTTTFVGEITPEIKYLGTVASSLSSPAGKYVNFNCSSTCEVWQIVKVENGRLVLTRQADYTNATSRTNSNRYNPSSFNPVITFNDDSLIASLSTDGKNVYLAKTVKITGGSGTQADPYILSNDIFNEEDKKVLAVITYKDGTTTLGTQNVYYNETNYISRNMSDPTFLYWDDGTNHYNFGDTITTITTDTNLMAYKVVNAVNLAFDNTITGFNCTDAQCALEELNNLVDPPISAATYISSLLTDTNAAGNKIYTGANPDNYVWFNGEQWRIIGVYGNNLKIIKATPSTTSQVYNSSTSSNAWSGSTMQSTYLYNTYWPTLSSTVQGMIEQSATWNVGACGYAVAAQAAYTCASGTTWTGKVGLIATYEYLYAAENDGTCWTTSGYDYDGGCYQKDWLFSTVTNGGNSYAWVLNPYSGNSSHALRVYNSGYVYYNYVTNDYAASPVVFLKSTITITGGNGQSGEANSYKLDLGS